jgi:hypothetical protein
MLDLALGIAAAVGASTLYSLGIALQATEAKEAPSDHHLRLALAWRLVQRARWLAGTGLSLLGWPLQVLALFLAPLVLVQPTLAAGLLVLVVIAERMLGERAGRREHAAMAVIVLSVAGIALTAPHRGSGHSGDLSLTLVLVALGAASAAPYLLRAVGRTSASVTMIGAGLGYAWSGVATALAADALHAGHLRTAGLWALSTAAASAVGALSEMSALQARPAIQVAPVVFVTQTAIPVALAPLLLGESFAATPAGGVPLALSIAVLVAAAASLARSPLLLALMEPEIVNAESGSAPSPRERSQPTIRATPSSEEPEEPRAVTTSTSPARVPRRGSPGAPAGSRSPP